ncbi:glycosyl transferase family 1 [Arenimonas maotaiensis]|jgi:glycosyltransferase involved in cell wall biosynthesis|uniref:Glycosyl transferase family 1 n=1 Tax=Arenimonas maotaiensis TaxID=1446479 RepID=A0A917CM18_9GAMM|nr:glycosyltransferase [Arenimonas maotaiensis]GGF90107.1 glycosyl transferase family 1 [Arenimonas maotaiensis]
MAEKKRLLVLASTYPRWQDDPEPGFVHELSKRLTDAFEVTVLCPHAAGAKINERMDGVDVRRYRYAPTALETLVNNGGINGNLKKSRWKWLLVPGFLLSQCWHTLRIIRRLKPDVVHAHWIIPQGLVLCMARLFTAKAPFVLTSHGADLFTLKGSLMAGLKANILSRAAFVTVVSEPMRQQALRLGVQEDRVAVMPMGVDFEKFTPSADVARNPNEILFVGRLVEKKGLSYLVRALERVRHEIPDVRLTVIGFGPEEPALRKLSTELGLDAHIDFIGPKPHAELIAHYRRAALFVAPFIEAADGDQEGLGLVTIEAIACGCPVLVGDVQAVNDVPINRVDCRDVDRLSSAVLRCLRIPGNTSDDTLREFIEHRFSWNYSAKRYIGVLGSSCLP